MAFWNVWGVDARMQVLTTATLPKPLVPADRIFWYAGTSRPPFFTPRMQSQPLGLVQPVVTLPLFPMIMWDFPRDRPILYQIFACCSVWSWCVYLLSGLFACSERRCSRRGLAHTLTCSRYTSAAFTPNLRRCTRTRTDRMRYSRVGARSERSPLAPKRKFLADPGCAASWRRSCTYLYLAWPSRLVANVTHAVS